MIVGILFSHQEEALGRLENGKILVGGVGSGKSLVGAAWASSMDRDVYVITTARKRDLKEWESEFDLLGGGQSNLTVASWNQIKNYSEVSGAVFIFDEQRLIGNGTWVKSFLRIAKRNKWILLSATPGDTWMDYVPVFIANGYYRNRTEFLDKHVVWDRFAKYPKVSRYVQTDLLEARRRKVVVPMPVDRHTKRNREYLFLPYDKDIYTMVRKTRQDPETGEPLLNAAGVCLALRKVYENPSKRDDYVFDIYQRSRRIVVFDNVDYEREHLLTLKSKATVAEWSGHAHESIPNTDEWIYLVQYTAGAEGWNCTLTDTIVFYSLNYSWRILEQSEGRIDRINTPYTNLRYYYLATNSSIDKGILEAIQTKKAFNEPVFVQNFL